MRLEPGSRSPASGGRTHTTGPVPVIVLAPAGLSEPFRITLALGSHRVRVSSDGVNSLVIEDLGL